MVVEPIAEGEVWAFRKASGRLEEVTILKVMSQSGNSRIRIQFEDGPSAGQVQWVSRRMLKAPWSLGEEYLARERCWDEARNRAASVPEYETDAAAIILDATVDGLIASDHGHGILKVRNMPALLELLEPLDHPSFHEGFTEEGSRFIPWPAMQAIAKDRARSAPDQALREIEAQASDWAEHEQHLRNLNALSTWPDNERPLSKEDVNLQRAWGLAREWCGAEAAGMWAETEQLRAENLRLAKLLAQALDALAAAGSTYQANRLRGQAGEAFKKRKG